MAIRKHISPANCVSNIFIKSEKIRLRIGDAIGTDLKCQHLLELMEINNSVYKYQNHRNKFLTNYITDMK